MKRTLSLLFAALSLFGQHVLAQTVFSLPQLCGASAKGFSTTQLILVIYAPVVSSGTVTGYTPHCTAISTGLTVTQTGNWTIASGGGITLTDQPTITGAINGTNAVFTLPSAPTSPNTIYLYRNGALQCPATAFCSTLITADFTLSGTTITFNTNSIPQSGDTLSVTYH